MNEILGIMLSTAVPLYIHEMRHWSPQRRSQTAEGCTDLTTRADVVLEPSRKEAGTTAQTFNAVARGLACLAYQLGGVTFLGQHWCVDAHDDCPGQKTAPRPARRRVETFATIGDAL